MRLCHFPALILFSAGIFFPISVARAADPAVQVLLNGAPVPVGTYPFPFSPGAGLVMDNGLIRFTFNRDDATGGIVTGWDGSSAALPATTSITAVSVTVNGRELAHNLNGVDPRDPDRQHSFYIDEGGGKTRLVCSEARVLRASPDLVEVVFADTTSAVLRHEHHLIMRRGKPGLYGYDILRSLTATSISEVRMNVRWDRAIFDHAFNWERGAGQQPTYGYLATQTSVGDETWRVDAGNNAALPAGTVYTKYNWSLYHHENPMFGHYGNGFGAWFTPLGGVTDQTLAAFYGVGPNHQDLAIHQDALILNYFGPNHYGLPAYSIPAGYARLYGPWFVYVNSGDPSNPAAMIDGAAAIAQREIAENRAGSDWIADPLYPSPAQRTTVSGRVQIADGRPADGVWALLSTQDVTEVYTIHEPTYFVKTDAFGRFSLPGIPAGTYSLYCFSAKGSITGQFKQAGVVVSGATQDLGTISWTPPKYPTFLWQIGSADRMGGEFNLASRTDDMSSPRSYEKPALIPANLTFSIGANWEPQDWYYAQTNAGVWTVSFNLDRVYSGTAYLTVSSSMQQGGTPVVAINGSSAGITGTLPSGNDSTIARQADRSGRPLLSVLTFPASRLVVGNNTLTFTKGAAGSGFGWDTVLLEVNETTAPAPARLTATAVIKTETASSRVWTVTVTNAGAGAANLARLDGFVLVQTSGSAGPLPRIVGRDPHRFPLPLGMIPAGASASIDVTLDLTGTPPDAKYSITASFSANGGSVTGLVNAPRSASRIANFSIRATAGIDAQTLIVGFGIGGAGTAGAKPMLFRGAGPALTAFGVPGALADPKLQLFSGPTKILENDNWSGDPLVAAMAAQVGAFSFTSAASRDAALSNAATNPGGYTAQLSGVGGTTGIVLAEIYDATPPAAFADATPRLINVSARTQVGTGADILIAGFVVSGSAPKNVLIRAIGPALANFGVPGVLADPKLELFSGSSRIGENDNWSGADALAAGFASVGAFTLDPASKDAALLATLAPGSYTVQVSGVANTTGVALVEIYEMP